MNTRFVNLTIICSFPSLLKSSCLYYAAILLGLLLPPGGAALGREAALPVTPLRGLDPVALCGGQEVQGSPERSVTHGHYRYLFATAENQKKFEAAPERFAIRFDGACMKMGPLSGSGGPDRFYVHDGRLYLFASETCRDRFRAEPEKYLDRPDEPPSGSAAEMKRGHELLERALAGLGGADKVDGLTSYRAELKLTHQGKDKLYEGKQVVTMAFPERWRVEESWGDSPYGHGLSPTRAVSISKVGVEACSEDVREVVIQRYYHNVLPILRARGEKGFVSVAAGRGEVNGTEIQWVKTGFKGATTALGIETSSGRILQVVYQRRTPTGIGEVRKTYSDFRQVDGGLTLPFRVQTAYNGQLAAEPLTYVSLELDRALSASEFPSPD